MKVKNWRVWDLWPEYGETLFKRATGDAPEMESSKATCEFLSRVYRRGMSVLDVGCGAGHYYRSLMERLDPDIDYHGVDITEHYIELAKKAYSSPNRFSVGDIYDLQFPDKSIDIVFCSNALMNLPPPPTRPIEELIRVARNHVIIRTLLGERNYIVKELRTLEEAEGASIEEKDLISPDGAVISYHYNNMYTQEYLTQIIRDIDADIEVTFERDTFWSAFDNRDLVGPTATRVLGDKQVSGNLIFDWWFITLSK